jgi:hypothetical protein
MVEELYGYEFQPVHSKEGKDYMFGELEAYLDDQISTRQYEETNDHYIITCPICKKDHANDPEYRNGYYNKKLYVKKDKTEGYCFVCHTGFINIGDEDEEIRTQVETPNPIQLLGDFELTKLTDKKWRLDLFEGFDEYDEKGMEYLIKKRHSYMKKLAPILGIRYLYHNPVIPFYYHKELFYYQVRNVFGIHHAKYQNPPIENKPAYVIEHGDNKKFIICEGTFDAISLLIQAPTYTPFAVLGSTITDYQVAMLRTYVPEKILVYLDKTELSVKVAEKLRYWVNYADIGIIHSDGMDPEEKLKFLIAEERNVQWIK